MADLPQHDLESDFDSVEYRRGHRVSDLPYSSDDKHLSTMDDRVDSGVGYSLESGDFSSFSIERERLAMDSGKMCQQTVLEKRSSSSVTSDNLTSGLQNQLRDLSLRDSEQSKDCLKSNRCDSGICDSGNFSEEGPYIQSAFAECHLSSSVPYENHFSAQELDELFSQDEDGDTHLHMSIIHLLPEVSLKIIALAQCPEAVDVPNMLHQTPLHLAVATRQRLIARRLMVAGSDLHAPDHAGNTPLHNACRQGLVDMVRILLTPVHPQETLANSYPLAPCQQRTPVDLSLKNYDGYTCAHLALQGGYLNILQLLLHQGACVNEPDGKSGRTLLHMAADLGYGPALDMLLRVKNLDLNARTYGGLTAISLAHGRRLDDVVQRLYYAGADCSQLSMDDTENSTDEEMNEYVYDDICINGQPVQLD